MTETEVKAALLDCLQEMVGEKFPTQWEDGDDIIERCALDSQHGVELADDLGLKLNIEIPAADNPLILDYEVDGQKKHRHRSLHEVVEYVKGICDQQN